MPFGGPLRLEYAGDGVHWILLEDLVYTNSDGEVFIAHAGEWIDGASIPKIFWSLVGSPMTGRYVPAAVIHDALYKTIGMLKGRADNVLYEAMLELNEDRAIADIIYKAVQLGGQSSFDADQALGAARAASAVATAVEAAVAAAVA